MSVSLLTKRDLAIAFVFTIVEIITLTVWLYILNLTQAINGSVALPAVVFLGIGLFVEHTISRIK